MLAIQKFLRDGGTPISLLEKYAIKSQIHPKYPNLFLFKYNQIDSPFGEEIVRDARGIILDKDDDWNIVSLTFRKFFNYGEGHAAPIDWTSAKVQEKLDGSLMQLYNYKGDWQIASSGMPAASANMNGYPMTFADLFWQTFKLYEPNLDKFDPSVVYAFELMTPMNRVVVRHMEPKLALIGARNMKTLEEIPVKEAIKDINIPVVKEFPLNSFDAIVESLTHIDPLSQEGYVVVDGNFNRVKCKSVAYVALHHMKDGMSSQRSLMKVVLNGEISEVLTAFPEYKDQLTDMKSKLETLLSDLSGSYEPIEHIENQKEFALQAVKSRCPGALFAVRKAKQKGEVLSFMQYLQGIIIDNVMQLLGIKIVKEEKVEE